jgi:hypothetical protein
MDRILYLLFKEGLFTFFSAIAQVFMQDLRLVTRLNNYWNLIRRGKPMPDISYLNTAAIDDMWQQCLNISVHPGQGGSHYHYVFMGEKLIRLYGKDLTNQPLRTNASEYPMNVVVGRLEEVAKSAEFTLEQNQFVNNKGVIVKYRACFMPFGNDAKGVTNIVVGFSGREFEQ